MNPRHIAESKIPGRRLGRHVHHDPRSLEYPATGAHAIKSVIHSSIGLPLDQGALGSCTANALVGALNSRPNLVAGATASPGRNEQDAVRLYELETQLEGEPYPPNDPGGTGLMVCRAAKQLGWVHSYRHAFGLDHALRALVIRPVIFGIDWYEGFDTPDPNGVVSIRGRIRGGHEVCANEIDADRQLVGFWNSWGPSWGKGGRFYMSYATLERLLASQGDATVPHA